MKLLSSAFVLILMVAAVVESAEIQSILINLLSGNGIQYEFECTMITAINFRFQIQAVLDHADARTLVNHRQRIHLPQGLGITLVI